MKFLNDRSSTQQLWGFLYNSIRLIWLESILPAAMGKTRNSEMLSHVTILHAEALSLLHNLIHFIWLDSIISAAMSVKKK